jgi:hypothetical protein
MLDFAVLCHSALCAEGVEGGTYIYMLQQINMQR